MKHFDIFCDCSKFNVSVRFENCSGICITDQTAICTISEIMAACNGDLSQVRDKFNNHLLFESSLGGVFIDQLNQKEVDEFNAREAEFKAKQAEADRERILFEEYKASIAKKLSESNSVEPAPTESAPSE